MESTFCKLTLVVPSDAADRIVELAKHEFPQARLYVRSFDRGHSLRLIHPPQYQYFSLLRDKLHWGRGPSNSSERS